METLLHFKCIYTMHIYSTFTDRYCKSNTEPSRETNQNVNKTKQKWFILFSFYYVIIVGYMEGLFVFKSPFLLNVAVVFCFYALFPRFNIHLQLVQFQMP